ncbi:MAG TPA: GNAT family N-acetyltransferase [Cyanobacteria bacterium UBA11372]|nr:GNAT family N-acetyltransferase [Cyanobacteria bacterium UBA11372]
MNAFFETTRLIIRDWNPETDAEQAFKIYGDPDVMRFINSRVTASVEAQKAALETTIEKYASLNNGTGSWAVLENETGQIVGAILLKQLPDNEGNLTQDYEVGWHFRKASWGKGYATEAGKWALEYGFKVLKLPVIYAVAKPENYPSIRVMQRLGMIPMGRTKRYYGAELELFRISLQL